MLDDDKGAYILLVELKQDAVFNLAAKGRVHLVSGWYLYVGSARGGLRARLRRHVRICSEKTSKKHWHIDHVLTHPSAVISSVYPLSHEEECRVCRCMDRWSETFVPIPGFGATDCRNGCPAHFFGIRTPRRDMDSAPVLPEPFQRSAVPVNVFR